MRSLRTFLLWPLLLSAPLASWAEGVLVEEVGAGDALARAGIEPGDVLLAWRVSKAEGELVHGARFHSPFDIFSVGTEYAPRGRTSITLRRAGKETILEVPDGLWTGEFFAVSAGARLEPYRLALEVLAADGLEEGLAALQALADAASGEGDRLAEAWYRYKLATALRAAGRFDEAAGLTEAAVAAVEAAGHPHAASWLVERAGIELFGQGRPAEGLRQFQRVLEIRERREPNSLSVALALSNLAIAANIRSDFTAAREHAMRALEIRERLAPATLLSAESLHTLGNAALWSDDLESAEAHYLRALEIRSRLDPGGITEARNLLVLANVYWRYGQLAEAQAYYQQSLEVFRATIPDNSYVGEALISLGHVASDRRQLATAEDYYLQALENFEHSVTEGTQVADALLGLGNVARPRGDLEAAEGYYRRALEQYESIQPGGQRVALLLHQLGRLAQERGELDAAERRFSESLAIVESFGGAGPQYASRLNALGEVALARDEYELAANRFEQALARVSAREPSNLHSAAVLRNLGRLAERRGRFDEAVGQFRRALRIAAALAPGTLHEAQPAHRLGSLFERLGEQRQALEYYQRAIDALESQRSLLGGSDSSRASFEHRYGNYYKDYVQLLLELDEPQAAFDVVERYRARALLALLDQRDLDLARDLPAGHAVRLQRARWAYEQALEKLTAPEVDTDPAVLSAELDRLRSERAQAAEAARRAAPAAAATQDPQPLGLAELTAALDEETALLSYLVLEDAVKLFLISAAGESPQLQVFDIPVDAAELRERVHRFRLLVQSPNAGTATRYGLDMLARELYTLLVEPAERALISAGRLLIVPDGPLHLLPFAALARETESGGLRYLVEDRAVAVTLSGSLYVTLDQKPNARTGRDTMSLAAIGAPLSGAEVTEASGIRRAAVAGLPYALQEIEAIAGLYPDSIMLAGANATEERAKMIAPDVDIVHFAAHAVANQYSPMDSYLVLSRPAQIDPRQDNGLLQVWEILEELRIDAEVAVLSACDTALGREMGGEGLIGLTRAFHYAGARSVVASLWAVSDRSTSHLMTEFHRHLREGITKDEALRRAQLSLLRPADRGQLGWIRAAFDRQRSDFSHPYHWAAFALHGTVDWAR